MSLPSVSKPIAYSAKIINVKKLTETVCEITIEKPDSSFHLPGQFISVKIADGGKPCYRAYSLMTDYKGNLQIVVKLFDGGRGSSYLFAREEGDCLEILYPVGYFVFPEILKRKLYFIATGTGIAPIIAMLESLPSPKDKIIKVIFGLRADEDIFYEERIESLRSDFLDFEFILTLSRPTVEWQGKRGRVTSYLNKLDNDAQIFICGNGNMVNDVAALLEKKGVNRKDILFEKFN